MPIASVRVHYDVYRGEDSQEIQAAAIDHATNLLFEQAYNNNLPMPLHIQFQGYHNIVEAWYTYQDDPQIVFVCPECSEQIVGHNRDQIRDLLAKHYEIQHNNQKEQEND